MASDLDKLQGTWHITALESGGQKIPAPVDATVVLEGRRFKSLGMGAPFEGTVEIDDRKKPKTLDLVFSAGHAKGTRNVGIYRIDKDGWTLCLATEGTKRPTKFATEAGSPFALEKLQRGQASTSSTAAKAATAPAVKGSGPASEIDGDWAMVSAVFDGAPMDKSMVAWCKRVTRGNVTSVLAGPKVMLEATFTLDPSKTPGEIDYVNLAGANRGKRQAGIYELKNGTLQICMAAPGDPRPRDFASKKGDGRSFTTWRLPSA
jgi:uncharacterized protein (TIGR03067 family)